MILTEAVESWEAEEDDKPEADQHIEVEEKESPVDEEDEEVPKPKKKVEHVQKVRKDHINVVFIGHVGEFILSAC